MRRTRVGPHWTVEEVNERTDVDVMAPLLLQPRRPRLLYYTQPELDRWRKEWNQKTGNINTILLPDDEQAGAAAALLSLSDNAEGIFNHHGARGTSQMKAEMYKERVSLISVNNFNALRHLLLLLGLPNLVAKQAVLEQHKDIQAWSWWSIAEQEIICPGIDKGKDNAFRDVDINKIRGRDSFSEVL